MNEHIDKFNMLLQQVNYDKPPEIPELSPAAINLSFLQSLGKDWEVWGVAKGEALRGTPTAELIAEVRALAMRGKASSQGQSDSPTDQCCKAWKWESWQFRRELLGQNGRRIVATRGVNLTTRKRASMAITTMAAEGTLMIPTSTAPIINELATQFFNARMPRKRRMATKATVQAATRKGTVGMMDLGKSRSKFSYKPNFSYLSYSHSCSTVNHIANMTCLMEVNSSEISSPTDPSDWLLDSAANAFITPYKSDIRFYVETKVG